MSVTGRSSSITNAFVNAIIPTVPPTEAEELEALRILKIAPDDIRCAYCGDKATEWDHLRPIITDQKPTGYVTEIANLVPSCGKCNQSKGKSHWKEWMSGSARLSPKTRGVADINERIARLNAYEKWKKPLQLDIPGIVGEKMWETHRVNWRRVLDLLKESQKLANEIRDAVGESVRKTGGVENTKIIRE